MVGMLVLLPDDQIVLITGLNNASLNLSANKKTSQFDPGSIASTSALIVSPHQTKRITLYSMSSVYGLVLAGGQSSRMGRNKALLQWHNEPLFIAMAARLVAAGVDHVFVSGGNHLDTNQYGQTITDRLPGKGPLSGIHSALYEVPDNSLLVVIPVDMPLLSSELLQHLMSATTHADAPCYYQDFTLPVSLPVTPHLREQVSRAINSDNRKDYSVWRLLRKLEGKAISLPSPEQAELFQNTNTPEEWLHCQTIAEKTNA